MILLPTLNRVKLLKTFLDSVRATHVTTPGLVLIDTMDYEENMGDYADVVAESMPGGWRYELTGDARSMGDKLRHAFTLEEVKCARWVGLLNDDHFCVTDQWDKLVEAMLDGTNYVSTNDGHWNFGVMPVGLTAWSMKLLDTAGFPIYPRKLQHLYIDNVWKSIGETTGCWHETNKVNIEHRHVYAGKMEQDETFKKVYSQDSWKDDSAEFQAFMEQDFKGVCERIAKLREDHTARQKFG